jgi:hypothetical protein
MLKLVTTVCAAVIGTLGMAASAAPDKPLNAATTDSGTVCIVRASETDGYQFDADCQWHSVEKRDADGNLVSYRYQDKGALQPGQTAPSKAVRIPITLNVFGFATPCTGTETISPSGNYSSNLTCTN